jgi:hypothetical protein
VPLNWNFPAILGPENRKQVKLARAFFGAWRFAQREARGIWISSAELVPLAEQWLALRKEAGLTINPETAEVDWSYAQTLDPYGVHPDLPEEYQQIEREYFARSPGSDIRVHFDDLPEETRDALWKQMETGKARIPEFDIFD